MFNLRTKTTATCMMLASVGLSALAAAGEKEEGFKPLGNGRDMSNFVIVKAPPEIWSVDGNVIKCKGRPNGYFATKKSYKNYVLRLDFKYPKKAGNSGYLIHITGKHKVWPKCVEVQGQYAGACKIFPLGGVKGPTADDAAARKKTIKPHTEWNSVEIISRDGVIISKLNGVKIAECGPYDLKEGPIGFQSEGAEIHFRNIRIKAK